ncbi:hypothetical protein, partial [Nocardia abscessus]|uniref:hypothetical protein n=1 Tax=Nocardia abscessus TaxID=120957 RepID=UPI002453ED7C
PRGACSTPTARPLRGPAPVITAVLPSKFFTVVFLVSLGGRPAGLSCWALLSSFVCAPSGPPPAPPATGSNLGLDPPVAQFPHRGRCLRGVSAVGAFREVVQHVPDRHA